MPIRREVGDRAGEAVTLNNIGAIRFRQGDLEGARSTLRGVLELIRAVGDPVAETQVSYNLAVLLHQMGRADEAVTFLTQAVALAERTGHPELGQMQAFRSQIEGTGKG
ncbi:MAG TPA: tetratricopeptide repeat protein [Kineosporiaceae bacterium]|nr:tetratricopeptide repeat protein [Kineosporiaceae bacterium]